MYRIGIILYLFGLAFAKSTSKLDVFENSLGYVTVDTSTDFDLCDEYASALSTVDPSGCELSEMPLEEPGDCCGVEAPGSLSVVGGEPALTTQFPWIARIFYPKNITKIYGEDALICGGSLISDSFVLTAAHCVVDQNPVEVGLGTHKKTEMAIYCKPCPNDNQVCSHGIVRISIDKVRVHESYIRYNLHNDIALIKLKNKAPYTDFIRPICLPTSDLNKGSHNYKQVNLTVAGWGTSEQTPFDYVSSYPDDLMHLQVSYVPLEDCKLRWSWYDVSEYQVCAGGETLKSACVGDSGGPLMVKHGRNYQLVGIVSYGKNNPCGQKDIPGVYTNVYKYKKWIKEAIILLSDITE